MKRRAVHIALVLLLLLSGMHRAIAQNSNTLTVAEDHLTLRVNLLSAKADLDSLFKIAGVTVPDIKKFLSGDYTAFKNDGWMVASHENNIVQFERPLADLYDNPQNAPFEITTQISSFDGKPGYPDDVRYGVNKFSRVTVYGLASGLTRFILPGHSRAKRVFLSGSFNSWSTLKGVMTKIDGGWVLDVKLDAGVYEYKYIVDGGWRTDPNNLLHTDDGDGNDNSVFYKYNYTIKLAGYPTAQRVTLVGDFNGWGANNITMQKNGTVWKREMYLGDGKHQYRFLVDGKQVIDVANPEKEKDSKGNLSSVLYFGETINFTLPGYPDAKKVILTGNWDTTEFRLKRAGDLWLLPLILSKGNYNYNFIVDGKWVTDPRNDHQIIESDHTESFLAVKPNYTFKLKGYGNAKKVILAGTFNNWNPNGYTLKHHGDEWTIELRLKPGKYLYKFIVDGQWMTDPGNKYWEGGAHNGNSVLWIE